MTNLCSDSQRRSWNTEDSFSLANLRAFDVNEVEALLESKRLDKCLLYERQSIDFCQVQNCLHRFVNFKNIQTIYQQRFYDRPLRTSSITN